MRIGITCYPLVGGSGIVATELGMHLARRGHQVHFISYQLPIRLDRLQENVFFHEVVVSTYPLFKYPPYTLSLAAKMRDVVCDHQLDLLHVHYAVPHATAAFLARQLLADCRTKVITTLHGTDVTLVGSDPSFFEITKFSVAASDGVTAVSEFLKQETIDVFGIEKPIEVIPNFIDTDIFRPDERPGVRSVFAAEDQKLVMHLSNFRPVKRVRDVIETFRIIREGVKAKLVLIGEGPDTKQAQDLVDQYGLGEDVIFLGNQESVESILPAGDLFLLTSDHESFGLAALEAMACGMPVISTRAGGVPELVTDGLDGYLFPVGDVDAMGRAGIEILSAEEKLRTMKQAARGSAVERFSAVKGITKYEDFYLKVCSEGASRES